MKETKFMTISFVFTYLQASIHMPVILQFERELCDR